MAASPEECQTSVLPELQAHVLMRLLLQLQLMKLLHEAGFTEQMANRVT
jgi:hypothetical protein